MTVTHGDQVRVHLRHAAADRSRHVIAQHEQLGDSSWGDQIAIDAAIDFECGYGVQQCTPLVVVGCAAHFLASRQQQVVLHIENACGAVGAFQIRSEPREMPGFVTQHRALDHAAREMRSMLDPFEEVADLGFGRRTHAGDTHIQPGRVDRFPDLRGQRAAHGSGVLACGAYAAIDALRVVAIEHQEGDRIRRRNRAVALPEGVIQANDRECGHPALLDDLGALR